MVAHSAKQLFNLCFLTCDGVKEQEKKLTYNNEDKLKNCTSEISSHV